MDFDSRPYGPQPQEMLPPRRPEPLYGAIGYVAGLLLLIFVCSVLQYRYGMAGLAMTELMLLAVAVLCAIISGYDLGSAFPIRKPTGRQIGGTVVTWMGFWGLCIALALILAAFFPESLFNTNSSMTGFITSVPFPERLFVMAVMPAICEEALFRGFIQRSFARLSRWPRILIIGLIFGIMHLDLMRIPLTAILGIALTLVMVKTGNLLLPILLHFINNALSVFSTLPLSVLLSATAPDVMGELDGMAIVPSVMLATAFFISLGAPFLILAGNILLDPRRPHVPGRFSDLRPYFIAAGTATTVLALGFVASIIAGIATSWAPFSGGL